MTVPVAEAVSKPVFDTVLVANRGEIAVRVMRTLRRLGIRSVAVFSDADADARHVREADEAIRIGPAAARLSYLDGAAILAAAKASGAQAIHPGYGFLSENADFVRACAAAGVVFIGPSAAAVDAMGDKIRAKNTVRAAGVPVVPGRTEPGMTDHDLVRAAAEIGYPVLIKPSAGGGGKGMHVVRTEADLAVALVTARREAASSFGDDTLFLERYLATPRHIEVQVLGDSHGAVVHLGERECSLQRRHQKVIEEAPSPLLDAETRARIGAAAVATAAAVGYTGAGTVEFIVAADRPQEFFFMEMNTRLQVEHPVTELVTGLDLVEWQLRVAAGQALDFDQQDVRLTGHAVEARVYAETPSSGFLPSAGTVLALVEPSGANLRVDGSVQAGDAVGTDYDPMLAKVIAWAPDRATALSRLDRALGETVVLGLDTNIGFLRGLLSDPRVRAGDLDTHLIDDNLERLTRQEIPEVLFQAWALWQLIRRADTDLWARPSAWRATGPATTRWSLTDGTAFMPVQLTPAGPDRAVVQVGDGEPVLLMGMFDAGVLNVRTGTGSTAVRLAPENGGRIWCSTGGISAALSEVPPGRRGTGGTVSDGGVRSPMPGTVIAVTAGNDDRVREKDTLLVVEAMKMEHTIRAPHDGTVSGLTVRPGDQVTVGQLLATVQPVDAAEHRQPAEDVVTP